jgi:hypothetical protein
MLLKLMELKNSTTRILVENWQNANFHKIALP